ncbi:hypothetical protein niasHT_034451 [Heterodera trifolii]|uniref:Uncharacterized protein n=1 Tax=Heterodera trifolii TaxID=157864 RepID=A0ABD2HW33_9BILA
MALHRKFTLANANANAIETDAEKSRPKMYLKFHNVYPCWNFIIAALAINAVAMFGMVSNFSVIWVTYRTKTLRGTANFLIALCSFFDMLHEHGHLLFLYTALSGQNFLPISSAVRFCSVSLFGIGGIAVSIAFTGLDRLLCVLFPAFPRRVRPLPYLSAITLLCLASSVCTLIGYYKKNNETPNFMVTGTFSDLVSDPSLLLYAFILYSVTVLIYLITGFVIRKRAKKASNSSSSSAELINRRIFRSLLVIVLRPMGPFCTLQAYCSNQPTNGAPKKNGSAARYFTISPPGTYRVLIWSQLLLGANFFGTQITTPNECNENEIFAKIWMGRREKKMVFRLDILQKGNFDELAKCFAHFYSVITDENGKFLLAKNGTFSKKLGLFSMLMDGTINLHLIPMKKEGASDL